ncbi:ABC transporter, permease [Haloferula helveola]|uniref:ABC transporter, permease n=1 Tax=Haloferula helveola TaxID=490095 RepID=A0ABN6H0S4_9BACT|nr:ABC transporter, permease [Haloferula helveola]
MEAVLKHDLPDRFGSMLVKEMRQNMRRGSFVIPFLAVHALAVAAVIVEFQTGATDRYSDLVGMLNLGLLGTSGPLWIAISLVCALIMPLGGLVLMGQELEEGNHELLLLTKLSRWKVVRGKFFSLWSLCVLTLFSLLPYVIVRYQIGGVELVRDLACTLTVLALSAVVCAGAIGASSFRGLGARMATMLLFLGSALASGGTAIAACGAVTDEAGVFWHLNALAATACFVMMGLGLARSRLRLVVHAYEVKPSFMVVGLLFFTPFVVGMTTAMTAGFAGLVGLVGMGLVAIYADVTPKAPAWVKAPAANVPGASPPPEPAAAPTDAPAASEVPGEATPNPSPATPPKMPDSASTD